MTQLALSGMLLTVFRLSGRMSGLPIITEVFDEQVAKESEGGNWLNQVGVYIAGICQLRITEECFYMFVCDV